MYSHRTVRRFRRHLAIGSIAVLFHLLLPTPTQAAKTNFHTKPVRSHPSVKEVSVLPPGLPTIPDKPRPVAKKILTVRASAYSSTVDQTDGDPFTTASGAKVHDGTIAMNGIPFGTKIRIPDYFGDRVFTVEDRMNAKWGNQKIDIWMATRDAAKQWGVRTVTIEII